MSSAAAAILSGYASRQREDAALGVGAEDRSQRKLEARLTELEAAADLFYRRPDSVVFPPGYEEWLMGCARVYLGTDDEAQAFLGECRVIAEMIWEAA